VLFGIEVWGLCSCPFLILFSSWPLAWRAVKHRSHPARAPKTKLKPSVSQKWLRRNTGGINGFATQDGVQQAKKSAAERPTHAGSVEHPNERVQAPDVKESAEAARA